MYYIQVFFSLGFRLEASRFFIYTTLLFLTSFSVVSLCMLVSSLVDLLAVANVLVAVPLVLMTVSMNSSMCSDAAYDRLIEFAKLCFVPIVARVLHTHVTVCPLPINTCMSNALCFINM